MDLIPRLQKILDATGLDKAEFAEKCGISRAQMFKYLKGDQEPKTKFYRNLKTSFPEFDIEWLITGIGSIKKDQPQSLYGEFSSIECDKNTNYNYSNDFFNQDKANRLIKKLIRLEYISESQLDRVEKEIDKLLEIAEDVVSDIKKAEEANWQKDKEQKKEAIMATMVKTQRRKKAAG